jgi:hypothetical protein
MSRKSVRVAVVVVVAAAASVTVAVTAVAIVVVAAEESTAELLSADVTAPAESADAHAANSNARLEIPSELATLATSIGQEWSQAYVRALQSQERDIVGAWPGTIREARRQVLARVKEKLEPEQLDQLARITNLAARRGWETVSEPDLEA